MIGREVNAGDFLKSTLTVGDFTRKFKCSQCFINVGDFRPILGKGMFDLSCNAKIFLH